MASSIDVDRPIRELLWQAERRFDEKILALSSPEEQEHHAQMQTAPAAYALGQLSAAFTQAMDNFAHAFQLGQTDYTRTHGAHRYPRT